MSMKERLAAMRAKQEAGDSRKAEAAAEQAKAEERGELQAEREAVEAELMKVEARAAEASEAIAEAEAFAKEMGENLDPEAAAEIDAIKTEATEATQKFEALQVEVVRIDAEIKALEEDEDIEVAEESEETEEAGETEEPAAETQEASGLQDSIDNITNGLQDVLDDPATNIPDSFRQHLVALKDGVQNPDEDWSSALSKSRWESKTQPSEFISSRGEQSRRNIEDIAGSGTIEQTAAISGKEDAKDLVDVTLEAFKAEADKRIESEKPKAAQVMDQILENIPAGRERKVFKKKLAEANLNDPNIDEATRKQIFDQRKKIFEADGVSIKDFDEKHGGSTEDALKSGMSFGYSVAESVPGQKEMVDKIDEWADRVSEIKDEVKTDMADTLMREAIIYKTELRKAEASEDRQQVINAVQQIQENLGEQIKQYASAQENKRQTET